MGVLLLPMPGVQVEQPAVNSRMHREGEHKQVERKGVVEICIAAGKPGHCRMRGYGLPAGKKVLARMRAS